MLLVMCLYFTCVPVSHAVGTDTDELGKIYASFVPEFTALTDEEIATLTFDEACALFEAAFSVDSDDFSEDLIRTSIQNLGVAYKHYYGRMAKRATSTKSSLSSYTGTGGVSWTRDLDKSPFTLEEVSQFWWVVDVTYLTQGQAYTIAAGMDVTVKELLVQAAVADAIPVGLEAAMRKALGLSANAKLPAYAGMAIKLSIGALDLLKHAEAIEMFEYAQSMNEDDLLQVRFRVTGTSVIKEYEIVSVSTTYTTGSDNKRIYTFKDIPNPYPNYYGTWTKDDLGPYM